MHPVSKYAFWLSLLLLSTGVVLWSAGKPAATGPFLTGFFVALSIAARGNPKFRGFSFGLVIFASVAVAMYYPALFQTWGNFPLQSLIVPLLQLIMFGMGTAMSVKDFSAVAKTPKAVILGLVCQYTIMPFLGYALAISFQFPPEIAAGVILIGSAPSGLASNVMCYLARANLALSITLSAVGTLIAPLMTPMFMKVLANQLVPVAFGEMAWGITKIIILPIVAGVIFNKLTREKVDWLRRAMPGVSMSGIAFILMIITAAGRDNLLAIGFLLILACLILNLGGYFLGYWCCRLCRLDERSCRTIAFEVGMQNAGLSTGIALQMAKLNTVGLAAAVFGPMMNITGSTLATWWREKKIDDDHQHLLDHD
jgi:BASS family bile acid:Na+ symporter